MFLTEKPKISKDLNNSDIEKEKKDFIIKYLDKIIPVIENDKKAEDILENIKRNHNVSEEELNYLLEKFETKVFLFEKPEKECEPDAKRVLFFASDPLSYNTISPLIEQLKNDNKCQAIGLITDGISGKIFEDSFKEQPGKNKFKSFKEGKEYFVGDTEGYNRSVPVFVDALKTSEGEEKKYDVAITNLEWYNSASSSSFWSSKSNFAANKFFLIFSGYSGFSRKDLFKDRGTSKDAMEKINGIFCNDNLGKEIITHLLPDFPKDKIYITGTPVMDEIKIDKVGEYRKNGREKMKIKDDEIAILYLGDISEYHKIDKEIDDSINEKTFKKTVEAVLKAAKQEKNKQYVLLVRPHPRDPNKKELLNYKPDEEIPENLRIIPATNISIEEVRCAADITASIISVENNLAAKLGKPGLFLGYKQSKGDFKLGEKVLESHFGGKEILDIINKEKNLKIISSSDEFVNYLKKYNFSNDLSNKREQKMDKKTSADKIIDIVLTKL